MPLAPHRIDPVRADREDEAYLIAAGILIAITPILIIYLLFQRYLVSGLTTGPARG